MTQAPLQGPDLTASALLINEVGLHARPSLKLTQAAKRFRALIEVATAPDGPWVDAKSPVKTMRVKALKGETLHFRATGVDSRDALDKLVALVRSGFREE